MLKNKIIELRALEPSDVELLYNWENKEELWYLSNTISPFSRFVLEQYVMNSHQDIYTAKQLRLMIDKIENQTPITIGSIDLFDFDPINKRAGIGIMIITNERKKGYATEAVKLLIDYCFNILGLHQVFCNIETNNRESFRLFSKLKFEVIGIKKEWLFFDGKWADEYMLQLLHPNLTI